VLHSIAAAVPPTPVMVEPAQAVEGAALNVYVPTPPAPVKMAVMVTAAVAVPPLRDMPM